jgi:hypothetical protein
MESQRHVEEINAENEKLRIALATRADTIKRLQQVSLASAALLTSVDSTAPQTEPSSLELLSRLQFSPAVSPPSDEAEPDFSKAITGKFLSQLLALVAQGTTKDSAEVGIIHLLQLEMSLNELLKTAEEKELIPKIQPNASWKKRATAHQPLYAQFQRMAQDGGGGDEDQGEEDDAES